MIPSEYKMYPKETVAYCHECECPHYARRVDRINRYDTHPAYPTDARAKYLSYCPMRQELEKGWRDAYGNAFQGRKGWFIEF